ncbi:MAG: sigma-70 family RNA polymerase sigma factor, partial [Nitrospira sp.]|nr:sigma-70 family RNA polymerase sigma factor [Nitrospira sp.]
MAEDVVQDVLMVLHEKYPQVTSLTELVPLSFQILRYKMLDLHRKTLRRGEYLQESIDERPVADCEDDPSVQAEQKERVEHLIEAL